MFQSHEHGWMVLAGLWTSAVADHHPVRIFGFPTCGERGDGLRILGSTASIRD